MVDRPWLEMRANAGEFLYGIYTVKVLGQMYERKRGCRALQEELMTKADMPSVFFKYYPSYANGSMSVTELARICGLSRPTIYKYIKMVGN